MPNNRSDLVNDKKRQLIQKYMQQLTKEDPSLYYSSTTEIANSLLPMIKEHINRMPVEDQALVRNITVRDIEMLLSFHK